MKIKSIADRIAIALAVGDGTMRNELMTPQQISTLRDSYKNIEGIDPSSAAYGRITGLLDSMNLPGLRQLAVADIKFISGLANNRVMAAGPQVELLESPVRWGDRHDAPLHLGQQESNVQDQEAGGTIRPDLEARRSRRRNGRYQRIPTLQPLSL